MTVTQEHQTSSWRTQNVLTVEQAAVILGIGRASAYQAASTGDLPVVRVGRRLIVPVAALRRMLGEQLGPEDTSSPGPHPGSTQNTGVVSPNAKAY